MENRWTTPVRLAAARPSWCRTPTICGPSTASPPSIFAKTAPHQLSLRIAVWAGPPFRAKRMGRRPVWRLALQREYRRADRHAVYGRSTGHLGGTPAAAASSPLAPTRFAIPTPAAAARRWISSIRRALSFPGRPAGRCLAQHHRRPGHVRVERAIREDVHARPGSPASPGSALGGHKLDQHAPLHGALHAGELHHFWRR